MKDLRQFIKTIIREFLNENIGDESNDIVRTYLESKGYIVHNSNRNVIALRK